MTDDTSNVKHIVAALGIDRSRRRWRFIAILCMLSIACLVLLPVLVVGSTTKRPASYVARLKVEDTITDSLFMQRQLANLAKDTHAKAVVVFINSPGGTLVGGLTLYRNLRTIAKTKPVVVVMGTVAASAGYLTALAGDHIIANPGTLTGSVGVLMPLFDASQLAAKLGVHDDEITSGALKTATSPFKPRTPQARAYLQQTVMGMQKLFLDRVKERRHPTADVLAKIADGRILTGAEAYRMGLVDQLGGMQDARAWLEKTHKVSQNIPEVPIALKKQKPWVSTLVDSMVPLPQFGSRFMPGLLSVMN